MRVSFSVVRVSRTMILAVSFLLLAGCHKKVDPKEQIEKVLDEGMAALEDGDISAAADFLDDAYMDTHNRDKRALKVLALFASRQGRLMLFRRNTKIEINKDHAKVYADFFGLLGAGNIAKVKDLIPKEAHKASLDISFHQDGDDWLVTAIDGDTWHQAGL